MPQTKQKFYSTFYLIFLKYLSIWWAETSRMYMYEKNKSKGWVKFKLKIEIFSRKLCLERKEILFYVSCNACRLFAPAQWGLSQIQVYSRNFQARFSAKALNKFRSSFPSFLLFGSCTIRSMTRCIIKTTVAINVLKNTNNKHYKLSY